MRDRPFSPFLFRLYAGDLAEAIYKLSQEHRMSVSNVTGLADMVRQTRGILADLPAIVDDMKSTATDVMANVKVVKALTDELKGANTELKAAIGQLSNGAPPLETTTTSEAATLASSELKPSYPSYPTYP